MSQRGQDHRGHQHQSSLALEPQGGLGANATIIPGQIASHRVLARPRGPAVAPAMPVASWVTLVPKHHCKDSPRDNMCRGPATTQGLGGWTSVPRVRVKGQHGGGCAELPLSPFRGHGLVESLLEPLHQVAKSATDSHVRVHGGSLASAPHRVSDVGRPRGLCREGELCLTPRSTWSAESAAPPSAHGLQLEPGDGQHTRWAPGTRLWVR